MDLYPITYRFLFPNGELKEFRVELDRPSMGLHKKESPFPLPVWTELTHHQCSNCPLSANLHSHCPIAVNLVDVIDAFHDVFPYDESEVEVVTPSRKISARVKSTSAVGSLIGIFMVTSGCPIMDKMRPLVLTHLPFATTEESIYRAIPMYLMAQYLRYKKGYVPDWDLQEFATFYDEVNLVNQSFVKRLTTFVEKGALLNALVLLNSFASATRRMVTQERFQDVEKIFSAYFVGAPGGPLPDQEI